MSVNKCTFIGYIGREADIKTIDNGAKVAQFSIACTDRGYSRADGSNVPERTEWIPIVAWRGLAEIIERYTKKGSKIYVEGRYTTRSYDKDGSKRYITEIVAETIELLDPRREERPLPPEPPTASGNQRLDYGGK
ncbi:MAG: single-stranded DNA-binding protein [Bacteroides sp.]